MGDDHLILAPHNLFLQCLTVHSFSLSLILHLQNFGMRGGESSLNSLKSKRYLPNQESNDAAADDEY